MWPRVTRVWEGVGLERNRTYGRRLFHLLAGVAAGVWLCFSAGGIDVSLGAGRDVPLPSTLPASPLWCDLNLLSCAQATVGRDGGPPPMGMLRFSGVPPATAGEEVVSAGVAEVGADAWHAAGFRGQGIRIGIIDGGFAGYSSRLGTELPSSVQVWQGGSVVPPGPEMDHGTRVAEVVHDMAPDADLYLARVDDFAEFGPATEWLLDHGVQIINQSMTWGGRGLLDGGGDVNEIVTDAVDRGVFWANSAGNWRRSHWMGDFTDLNVDGDGDGDGWLDWNGQREHQVVWADKGKDVWGLLTWDDSWTGATQDYDLYLYRWDGEYKQVARSTNRQDGTAGARPSEFLTYRVPASGVYAWFILRYSAERIDVDFDFQSWRLDDGYSTSYFDYARSLQPPADNASRGFMAAAAVGRGPTFAQWEDSSEGPTRDGRLAPEIAAPSTVQTSIGEFGGTSAATPHLAGAAALVLQAFPAYTPAQVEDYLEANATDLGAAGPDNQYGYGLLHLPTPPAPPADFPDVPAHHPYAAAIAELSFRSIIGGYADGRFGPEDAVMRQQFAKMIVLSLGLEPLPAEQCPFGDVDAGWPYPRGYIATAAQHGITTGTTPATFAPWDNISRAQVVTMVVRALDNLNSGLLAATPAGYTGTLGNFSSTHAPAMAKAEHNGLLAGLVGFGSSWDPWRNATRGEVAQILWNALRLSTR